MIPAETIREMLKSATPGPWTWYDCDPNWLVSDEVGKMKMLSVEAVEATEPDRDLLASAPDLAQTALELYARVEELEREREACLKFCREQNGQEGCKNCGLGTGENWSINTPNECPIDGSCEACQ